MRRSVRLVAAGTGALALAGALLLAGGVLGSPDRGAGQPEPTGVAAPATRLTGLAGLQADTERVPLDPSRWSSLGLAYVQQARLTADPSWYAKAGAALERSLQLLPEQNAPALTGQAALAAGQHQFQRALTLADEALRFNDFNPTTYGVKVDALTELGRYREALTAAERMLDLRPGVDSYARLSYQLELRGDLRKAGTALQEAGRLATAPSDRAFVAYYLGELAFNTGDLATAAKDYDAAAAADPTYVAAQQGRAKVLAAKGQLEPAIDVYRTVVGRLPQPSYLAELGEVLQAAGHSAEAQEQYDIVRTLQQAYAAQGSNVDSELALLEADHGDKATSLRLATQAHRDRPATISVQDAYAWALHVNGRDAEALTIARQVVRLGTQSASYYAHLGFIEVATGAKSAGRVSLQKALALNPHFNPLLAPRATALLASIP